MSFIDEIGLNQLSEFSFPFRKDKIASMTMGITKDYSGNFHCIGRIHYQSGMTGGYQEFGPVGKLSDLLKQMEVFINEMI